jgi:hypothetical protein
LGQFVVELIEGQAVIMRGVVKEIRKERRKHRHFGNEAQGQDNGRGQERSMSVLGQFVAGLIEGQR